jgi:hypothetical protein
MRATAIRLTIGAESFVVQGEPERRVALSVGREVGQHIEQQSPASP